MVSSDYFNYHKGKVIQALRYHFITRKEIKWMMITVNVFSLVSALLFFGKIISALAFLLAALLWFILMLNFWFILPFLIFKRTETFKNLIKVQFSEEGLHIESNESKGHWGWKDFMDNMESPHFFHLYFSSRSFFIIPKELFSNSELTEVRQLLATHIKRQKK